DRVRVCHCATRELRLAKELLIDVQGLFIQMKCHAGMVETTSTDSTAYRAAPDRSPPEAPGTKVGFSSTRNGDCISGDPAIWLGHRKGWFKNPIPLKNDGDETRDHSACRNDAVRRIGGRGDACR